MNRILIISALVLCASACRPSRPTELPSPTLHSTGGGDVDPTPESQPGELRDPADPADLEGAADLRPAPVSLPTELRDPGYDACTPVSSEYGPLVILFVRDDPLRTKESKDVSISFEPLEPAPLYTEAVNPPPWIRKPGQWTLFRRDSGSLPMASLTLGNVGADGRADGKVEVDYFSGPAVAINVFEWQGKRCSSRKFEPTDGYFVFIPSEPGVTREYSMSFETNCGEVILTRLVCDGRSFIETWLLTPSETTRTSVVEMLHLWRWRLERRLRQ